MRETLAGMCSTHAGDHIWLLKLLSEVPASWLSGVRRYISETSVTMCISLYTGANST